MAVQQSSGGEVVAVCASALASCAGFNLRRASRTVTQLFDTALQPTGLRSTQVALLQMIATTDSPSVAQLAREMAMDPSTLSRNLTPLVREGFVQLAPAGRGRAKIARLTSEGKSKLNEVTTCWKAAQAGFVRRFGAERWDRLRSQLHAVIEALA